MGIDDTIVDIEGDGENFIRRFFIRYADVSNLDVEGQNVVKNL